MRLSSHYFPAKSKDHKTIEIEIESRLRPMEANGTPKVSGTKTSKFKRPFQHITQQPLVASTSNLVGSICPVHFVSSSSTRVQCHPRSRLGLVRPQVWPRFYVSHRTIQAGTG
jgi:hypothetical protein